MLATIDGSGEERFGPPEDDPETQTVTEGPMDVAIAQKTWHGFTSCR